jgi:hypothetical protein
MGEQLGRLKYFDASPFQALKDCSHREIIDNDAYGELAREILTRYEAFEDIRTPPSIRGIPFDYFAFKNDVPHLLVFRDPINRLRAPSDVLRLRLKILTMMVAGLETAHFQVHLRKAFYRVIYTDDMVQLTERLNRSRTWNDDAITPIVDWIRAQIPYELESTIHSPLPDAFLIPLLR